MNPILIGGGALALLVWALSGKDDKAAAAGKSDVSQKNDTEDGGKELRPPQKQTLPNQAVNPPKTPLEPTVEVKPVSFTGGGHEFDIGGQVLADVADGSQAGHDHGWDDIHPGKYGEDPGSGTNPNSGKPIGSREIDRRVEQALSAGFARGLAI